MSSLKEVISACEMRKHVAEEKVKIGYNPEKFKIVAETYDEILRDLYKVDS